MSKKPHKKIQLTHSCFNSIIFIIKRSEETDMAKLRPIRQSGYSHKPSRRPSTLLVIHHIFWVSLQVIIAILVIGGIEINPGPTLNSHLQENCNISHSFPVTQVCPLCQERATSERSIECSICFRYYHPQCITISSTSSSILIQNLGVRGKFCYFCESCCESTDKENFNKFNGSPIATKRSENCDCRKVLAKETLQRRVARLTSLCINSSNESPQATRSKQSSYNIMPIPVSFPVKNNSHSAPQLIKLLLASHTFNS